MKNKYIFRTTRRERTLFIVAALIFSLVAGFLISQTPTATRTIRYGVAYVPPPSIFGVYNTRGFTAAPFYYESALVNYSVPVADSDYLVNFGVTESVYLPGDARNRYVFIRTGYISGSGWFETWQTPNGGYIAFLHLSEVSIATKPKSAPPMQMDFKFIENHCKTFHGNKKKDKLYNQYCLNDDRTGIIVDQLIRSNRGYSAPNEVKYGGYYVGKSGWPTDPFYGLGTSGPGNAHLCVIYDQAGSNWLSYVTYQPKPVIPKPVIFDAHLWYSWHIKHHKPNISPYYGKKLSSVAQYWKTHTKACLSVTQQYIYDRKNKLTHQRFQNCEIFTWSHPNYKPKLVREKHIA